MTSPAPKLSINVSKKVTYLKRISDNETTKRLDLRCSTVSLEPFPKMSFQFPVPVTQRKLTPQKLIDFVSVLFLFMTEIWALF